jgi:phage shock protein A
MSGEPDSFVLVYLRRLDTKMDDLRADTAEVKQRLTTLEVQIASLSATESSHYAQVMQRLDRHEIRLDRIERRLDLIDVPVA